MIASCLVAILVSGRIWIWIGATLTVVSLRCVEGSTKAGADACLDVGSGV
jgi:hypothetical protein